MSEQEKLQYGGALLELLCPVSIKELKAFQDKWDGHRPYEEFCEAQAVVLRGCVSVEMTHIGQTVRSMTGKTEPLTWETEVKPKEETDGSDASSHPGHNRDMGHSADSGVGHRTYYRTCSREGEGPEEDPA
jgi:hypothetical protein